MENHRWTQRSFGKNELKNCLLSNPQEELPLPVVTPPMIKVHLQLLRRVTSFGLEHLPAARYLTLRAYCEPRDIYESQFLLPGGKIVRALDKDLPDKFRLMILEYSLKDIEEPVFVPGPLNNPDIGIRALEPMARIIRAGLADFTDEIMWKDVSHQERARDVAEWKHRFEERYIDHEDGRKPDLLGVAESHDLLTVFSALNLHSKVSRLDPPVHMHVRPSVSLWREGGKLTAATRLQHSFDLEGTEFMRRYVEQVRAILSQYDEKMHSLVKRPYRNFGGGSKG